MRKFINHTLAFVATSAIYAPSVFADVLDSGVKTPTGSVIDPDTSIGSIVSFIIGFLLTVAVLIALLYIVIGAFQWITSGGDKTKVESARNHIIAAIIGLIIIALSFVIINVVISVLGLGSLTDLKIKKLSDYQ